MLLATGCVKEDAVKVHEVENISFSMQGGTKIVAMLRVENASGRNIKVMDMDFVACDLQGNEIAQLTVDEDIYVPRRSETSVVLPIRVRLSDPVSGARLLRNLNSVAGRVTLTGTAVVKFGGIRKKYDLRDVPLSNIISNFEPTRRDVPKIIEGGRNI